MSGAKIAELEARIEALEARDTPATPEPRNPSKVDSVERDHQGRTVQPDDLPTYEERMAERRAGEDRALEDRFRMITNGLLDEFQRAMRKFVESRGRAMPRLWRDGGVVRNAHGEEQKHVEAEQRALREVERKQPRKTAQD